MKRRMIVGGIVVSIAAWAAFAPPASARWALGDGATNLDIVSAGPVGAPDAVCINRVHGRAGEGTFGNLADVVVPPGPYGTRTVEVFASPVPFKFDSATTGSSLLTVDNVLVPALASQTTAQLVALSPAEEYPTDFGSNYVEYAAAPFDITPPAGSIHVGDSVAVKINGSGVFARAVAIACSTTPPPTGATIDILPGTSANYVVPWNPLPTLQVRLFGSATFDVSKVAGVKLGSSGPTTLPVQLAPTTAVKDRNGDGFPDRDYFFTPSRTGIKCTTRTATLSGTVNGTPFSASDSVKPVLC